MSQVNALIEGIILHTDESVLGINIGNGFVFRKQYLNELSFKKRITDGEGKLSLDYIGSKLQDDKGEYFICIYKEDTYEVVLPEIKQGVVYSDRDMMCEEQIGNYKQEQMDYLHKVFSLLHLFKKGNIGYVQLFFEQKFSALGFINNTFRQTDHSVSKNVVDDTIFSLSSDEVNSCNLFLIQYQNDVFEMLKESIDEFVWGLEQIDIPTGFEQYTTALEMTMLAKNQRNKKECLAKRVAVLLESDPAARMRIYGKMKEYYRFRSESLHEGDGQNITKNELAELEDIVRRVLVKYLEYCQHALSCNSCLTWEEIKENKINEMVSVVTAAVSANELPQ